MKINVYVIRTFPLTKTLINYINENMMYLLYYFIIFYNKYIIPSNSDYVWIIDVKNGNDYVLIGSTITVAIIETVFYWFETMIYFIKIKYNLLKLY